MVPKKQADSKSEWKIVNDTAIKVRSPPVRRTRPEYRCTICNQLFPSELDLSEHQKMDHSKKAALSA